VSAHTLKSANRDLQEAHNNKDPNEEQTTEKEGVVWLESNVVKK
jgi:hypothetical protein